MSEMVWTKQPITTLGWPGDELTRIPDCLILNAPKLRYEFYAL